MKGDVLFTRSFVFAFGAHFLHALAFALYLHFPGFLRSLGAAEVQIGFIFGATGLTAILARPMLGRAMDARGRRVVIVVGGIAHALVCMGYLALDRLGPLVYAVRIVHGVAEAMLFAALFAFAADIVPERRRIQGLALFGVSGMLPMSLSGLLGDYILAHSHYATLFQVSSAFAFAGLLLSLALHEAPRAPLAGRPRSFFAAAFQRDLVPLWGAGICFATAITAYFTFMKTFVIVSGTGSVGRFFTAYSLAAIVLRIGLGSLPDRIGAKQVLYPALGSLAIGLLLLARATGDTSIVVAGVLCGLGHGFIFPIVLSFVVERARTSERGSALALYTAIFDGGTLLGGPTLGSIIRFAGYPAMFASAAGLVVLGGLGFALSERLATPTARSNLSLEK